MEECFRLIQKSDGEQNRLTQESRATHNSVFSPDALVSERGNKAPAGHGIGGANAIRNDGVFS
jgi:hypothetical protein